MRGWARACLDRPFLRLAPLSSLLKQPCCPRTVALRQQNLSVPGGGLGGIEQPATQGLRIDDLLKAGGAVQSSLRISALAERRHCLLQQLQPCVFRCELRRLHEGVCRLWPLPLSQVDIARALEQP